MPMQAPQWVQFTKSDFETSVKDFEGTLIGYKIYMDIRVNVEGRGHTFQQTLHVDPKDKFEHTMRTKTLMWNTFMTRGQNKCIIHVQQKGKDEDAYIAPNSFDKTFEELGVQSGCQITLIEMKFSKGMAGDMSDSEDVGEGGEDDMEDMEAELEENGEAADAENKQEDAAAAADESAVKEGGAAESLSPTGNVAPLDVNPTVPLQQ